jgi:hypothetical protein
MLLGNAACELLARLTKLPEEGRKEAIDLAVKSTASLAWVPNPGPQTNAFLCAGTSCFMAVKPAGEKLI